MLADRDLNDADIELLNGNIDKARALSAKWIKSPWDRQRERAWLLLGRSRPSLPQWFRQQTPEWLRQLLMASLILTIAWLILLITRFFWRRQLHLYSLRLVAYALSG